MNPLPRVACYGELLLRLSPPGVERLLQATQFEVHIGGAEANVAVVLAQWGAPVEMHSIVPEGPIGDRAVQHLQRYGVGVQHVARGGARLGLYYYEAGVGPRGGQVIYDRAGSGFADRTDAPAADAFAGVHLLHLTGISPAVSAAAAARTELVVEAARATGASLSLDLNYRSTLWQWGPPEPVMRRLAAAATILIADQTSAQVMLGVTVTGPEAPEQRYAALGAALAERAPHAEWVAFTHRSGEHYGGYLWLARERRLVSVLPVALQVVERIGGGDAFTAGLLYGWLRQAGPEHALRLALAAAALKHTIAGDVLIASRTELDEQLSTSTPRLKR